MSSWRRKRWEVEAEATVKPDFHYWYYGCKCAPEWRNYRTHEKYQYCFELCYDEEVGDKDFARICTEILVELFSPYWTSMWVRDSGHNHGFLLPNGEALGKKEDFFAAFSRYLRENEVSMPVLLEKKSKDIAVFSDGLYLPVLRSYLSDLPAELPVRGLSIYGYREAFLPSEDYIVELERRELLGWSVLAEYGECRDSLEFFANDGEEIDSQVFLQTVRRVCEKYGKNLRVKEEW